MKLKKYFQKGIRAGKLGLTVGLSAFLINCENILGPKDNYEDYLPGNAYEIILEEDLETPAGLSAHYRQNKENNLGKSVNINTLSTIGNEYVFCEGPIYYQEQGKPFDFSKSTNPKLWKFSGGLASILQGTFNKTLLTEFPLSEYRNDFHGWGGISVLSDSTQRPIGQTLDALLLENGSVLLYSSGNKIFEVDSTAQKSVYLESNELYGTTDMELFKDGTKYLTQVQVDFSRIGHFKRDKRIISIDSLNNINIETEIPTSARKDTTWWVAFDEVLKIAENSPIGKERFEYDFYVSDLLADKIYGVKEGILEVLIDDIRYPSSIRVGVLGNLFYTTSPLWLSLQPGGVDDYIDYPTELHWYRLKTGDDYLIHTFNERNVHEYASSGRYKKVEYNGKIYNLPTGFNVSSILSETDTKLRFLFTNSHQGTLKGIEADK